MKGSFRTYFERGVAFFLTIAACIIFFFIVYRIQDFKGLISTIIGIINPFIYGAVIAYLLMPLKKMLMARLGKLFNVDHCAKGKGHKRRKFILKFSVFICIVAAILIIYGLIALIVPQLIDSISSLVTSAPSYYHTIMGWIDDFTSDNAPIWSSLQSGSPDIEAELESMATQEVLPNLRQIMTGLSSGILNALIGVKDLLIGLIVATYILDKSDTFLRQTRMIIHAAFPYRDDLEDCDEQTADWIMRQGRILNDYMSGFINGKLLDSLIIGLICLAFTTLVRMPYAVLVSVIVGVTNVIPFFGPFIGAIPSALLILIEDPVQCVVFVIFIIILQQFDGNILGPHILGNATNLDSFWVLFAILFFGGLFGMVGMVIGVPLFGFIYQLIRETVNKRLMKQSDRLSRSPKTADLVKYFHRTGSSSSGDDSAPCATPSNGAYPSFEPNAHLLSVMETDRGKHSDDECPDDEDA